MTLAALLAFSAAVLAGAGAAMVMPDPAAAGRNRAAPRWLLALAALGGRLRAARPPRDLNARIAAAGAPGGLGVREVFAAKLAGAAGGAGAGLPLAAAAPGRLGAVFAVAAPVAGFLGPDLWLARIAKARARRARRDLPGLLDLLRVTVEAGSSLPEALRAVGERAGGPVAREWRAAGRQVGLGVPLEQALAEMQRRLPLPEIRALTGALDRARRHGAPLAETLAAQAHDTRLALRRAIQEEAARAGPKIQLVVALLLVPSVLLLVAAALVAALLEGDATLAAP